MLSGLLRLRSAWRLLMVVVVLAAVGLFAVQLLFGAFTGPSVAANGTGTMLTLATPTGTHVSCAGLAPSAPTGVSASVAAGNAVGFTINFTAPGAPQQRVSVANPSLTGVTSYTYKFDSDASTVTGTLGVTADSTSGTGSAQNVTVKWRSAGSWTSATGYSASCPAVTITGYEISLNGGSTWTNVGPLTTGDFIAQGAAAQNKQIPSTLLVGNTSYTPQLRAVNAIGSGASATAGAAVRTNASAPSVTLTGGSRATSATLSFALTAPAGEPAPYSYQYSTDGGTVWATLCTYSAASQTCTATNRSNAVALTFDTAYSVAVRTIGINGGTNGPGSTPATGTTQMGVPTFSMLKTPNASATLGLNLTGVNTLTRYDIGRTDTNGVFEQDFNPFSTTGVNTTTVYASAVQTDNKIIIGGNFTSVNGTARGGIARLSSDGTLDTTFGNGLAGVSGASATVYAVALQSDGKVLIGGSFTSVNGTAKSYIARLNTDGSLDTGFTATMSGTTPDVRAIKVQSADQKIVVGGYFTSFNGGPTRNYATRFNTDGTEDITWRPNLQSVTNGAVNAIAIQSDGQIVLGGLFSTGGGSPATNIARFDTNAGLDTTFRNVATNDRVTAVGVQSDGKVVIGGNFTTMTGGTGTTLTRNGIGRFDADVSNVAVDTTYANGLNGVSTATGGAPSVNALVVQSDNEVIIGGTFGAVNLAARNNLARLNTDGTLDTGFAGLSGSGGTVNSLTLQSDGKVIVGTQTNTIYAGPVASSVTDVRYSTDAWSTTGTATKWATNTAEFPYVWTFTNNSAGSALSTATAYTVVPCVYTSASGVCGAPGASSASNTPFLSPSALAATTRTTAAQTTDSAGTTLSGCATTCQPSETAVFTTDAGGSASFTWPTPTLGTSSPAVADYDYEYDALAVGGAYSGTGTPYLPANIAASAANPVMSNFTVNTQYRMRYRVCFVGTIAAGSDPNCSDWSAWSPSFTPLSTPAAPTLLGGYGSILVMYPSLWSGSATKSVPGSTALKVDVRRSSPWKDDASNRWDGVGAGATSSGDEAVVDLGLGMGATGAYQYRFQAPDGSRSKYSVTASATTVTPSNYIAQPCSGTGWTNASGTSQASTGIEAWGSTCNYVSGSNQYSVCASVTTGTTNGCWSLDSAGAAGSGYLTGNKYIAIFFKPTTQLPAAAGTILGIDYSTYSQFYIRQTTSGTITGCGRQGEATPGSVMCSTTTGLVTTSAWHLGVLNWVPGSDGFGGSKYVRMTVRRDGDVIANPNLVASSTTLTGTNSYLYADSMISIYGTLYAGRDYTGNNWSGNVAWFMAG